MVHPITGCLRRKRCAEPDWRTPEALHLFKECSAEWGGDGNCHPHWVVSGGAYTTPTSRKKTLKNGSGVSESVLASTCSLSADGGGRQKIRRIFSGRSRGAP